MFFEQKSFQIAFKFSFDSFSVVFLSLLSSADYLPQKLPSKLRCILERDFFLELRVAWGLKN
jgi:hypothetical protein